MHKSNGLRANLRSLPCHMRTRTAAPGFGELIAFENCDGRSGDTAAGRFARKPKMGIILMNSNFDFDEDGTRIAWNMGLPEAVRVI